MSKIWEFALTPKRLAIVTACLGMAGLVLAAAGFEAGLILAPRVRSDLALIPKKEAPEAGLLARARKATTAGIPSKPSAAQPATPPSAKQEGAPEQQGSLPAPIVATGSAPTPPQSSAQATAQPPETKTSAVPGNTAGKQSPIQLDIQVASFTSDEKARSTVVQLRDSGYPATDVSLKDALSQEWHVVEVGPYAAHETASRTVLELSTRYGFSPVIVASRIR